ncbi:MAG: oligosaccharide flippase family protein [Patescibacteria group bacterium]
MSYKSSFISGVAWNGTFKVLSKVVSAIKLAVLARLLTPRDFGVFSLVLVSISLVEVFTESGINTILVQSQKKIDEYISTAWIFSICRGVVISVIMIAMAFLLSSYYKEPSLVQFILFASGIPLVRGFINPAIINFYKELDFKKDTFYRMSLVAVDFCAAISAAFIFKNTYALIIPIFFSTVADVFISFYFVKVKPKFEFSRVIFKEIFHQTKWLNNISILDYLNKNLDNLIIGKILGTETLGFYQNAYAVTQSATSELGLSVIHASFPIYSRLSNDLVRLKTAFVKVAISFSILLVIPTMILVLFPQLIVKLQFGNQWVGLAAILPILAVSGYIQGLFNIGSTLFTVRRKYYFLSMVLATTLVSMVIGILVLTPKYGLIGGASSVLISRLVTLPIFFYFIIKTLKPKTTIDSQV